MYCQFEKLSTEEKLIEAKRLHLHGKNSLFARLPQLQSVLESALATAKKTASLAPLQRKITSYYPDKSVADKEKYLLHLLLFLVQSGNSFYITDLKTFQDWIEHKKFPHFN